MTTIKELEKILDDDSYDAIRILPDGSVEAYRSEGGVRVDAKPKILTLKEAMDSSY